MRTGKQTIKLPIEPINNAIIRVAVLTDASKLPGMNSCRMNGREGIKIYANIIEMNAEIAPQYSQLDHRHT